LNLSEANVPELPEVQTVVSDLNKKIKGDTIVGFWSDWGKTLKNISVEKFTKDITGRKILGARRIGKNIFIDLSGNKTIYIHLKMTGHLLIKFQIPNSKFQINSNNKNLKTNYFDERVNQYIHHKWFLNSKIKNSELNQNFPPQRDPDMAVAKLKIQNYDKVMEFSDLRKFGKIVLVNTDKLMELKEIKELGVDAMSPEFTFEYFNNILEKKKHKKIRDILMDQNLIAGIGNIYLSEILFDAEILPMKIAGKLKPEERKIIYQSIKKILKKAIKLRGTSDSDYRDTDGAPGGFQKVLRAYQQEGKKCGKCGKIIKRIKMGQRSVFYCPICQK
jgi:formamidopyrimidine-DNA glycosylase